MTSKEIKDIIAKAEEKAASLQRKIEQFEIRKENTLEKMQSHGWNYSLGRYQKQGTEDYEDCYWLVCKVEEIEQSIKSNTSQLEKAKITLEAKKEALKKQLKLERTLAKEIPEVMKQLQKDLAANWTASDKQAREHLRERRAALTHKEFREYYSHTQEEMIDITDYQIVESNLKAAEVFIIDLYNRVKNITGKVTDWSNIHYSGNCLNGLVVGKKGKAEVETIIAGGHNIQRRHYRVLVKDLKKHSQQ